MVPYAISNVDVTVDIILAIYIQLTSSKNRCSIVGTYTPFVRTFSCNILWSIIIDSIVLISFFQSSSSTLLSKNLFKIISTL